MARIRHLSNAPIVEALVDLKVHVPDRTTFETLEQALAKQEFGYQTKGPIFRGNFGMAINLQESPQAKPLVSETTRLGMRLHSDDEKYVAQFTTEGFTFSRLAPYESWELLITEARRVWSIYQSCVSPTRVHRAGTRFINNLRLPMQAGDRFKTYLKGLPSMPPEYPQTISSFLQRFVVHEEGATALITQALEQFPADSPVPVFLDIDVFREADFHPNGAEVWSFLGQLRNLKNRFFFGAIEEAAAELYE
ncbi:MAG: TIGR04255 family protein [Steroidobacteraceae bacterium]|jgi:uncharacterized protein (TIGR04255 family)